MKSPEQYQPTQRSKEEAFKFIEQHLTDIKQRDLEFRKKHPPIYLPEIGTPEAREKELREPTSYVNIRLFDGSLIYGAFRKLTSDYLILDEHCISSNLIKPLEYEEYIANGYTKIPIEKIKDFPEIYSAL